MRLAAAARLVAALEREDLHLSLLQFLGRSQAARHGTSESCSLCGYALDMAAQTAGRAGNAGQQSLSMRWMTGIMGHTPLVAASSHAVVDW